MPTYLLKWDATRWDWRNLTEQADAVKNGIPVSRTWTCGVARRIVAGDRVFIIRLGREPRGIVAAGRVTRGSYEAPGLEQQDGARTKGGMYVDVRFDALFEPRREAQLPRPRLAHGALGSFMWDIQQSGTQLPEAIAQELESVWEQCVAGGPPPAVAPAGPSIAEQERAAAEKADHERLAKEKAELERRVKEAAEQERVAREKADSARAEQERLAKEKSELERRAKAAAEQERLAREKAEREKAERERLAKEKLAREAAERERIAKEKTEQARLAKEKAAREHEAKVAPAATKSAGAPKPAVAAPVARPIAPAPSAPRPAMYPEIVADYFAMLAAELRGELYSKADHRARLAQQLGLDDADSIDVAHQQVSGVLLDLGLPTIDGFRPLGGTPATLRSAVHGWIEAHPHEVEQLWIDADPGKVPVPVELDDSRAFHMPLPPRADLDADSIPRWTPAAALDLDFRAREALDERLIVAGQRFVLAFERARLREAGLKDLVGRVEWVAQDRGDALGFHVRSFDDAGKPRSIIVKTTNYGARFPLALSALELATAREQGAQCCLYRVFAFSRGAKLWILEGPLDAKLGLAVSEYLAVI